MRFFVQPSGQQNRSNLCIHYRQILKMPHKNCVKNLDDSTEKSIYLTQSRKVAKISRRISIFFVYFEVQIFSFFLASWRRLCPAGIARELFVFSEASF